MDVLCVGVPYAFPDEDSVEEIYKNLEENDAQYRFHDKYPTEFIQFLHTSEKATVTNAVSLYALVAPYLNEKFRTDFASIHNNKEFINPKYPNTITTLVGGRRQKIYNIKGQQFVRYKSTFVPFKELKMLQKKKRN
jgi:hypothetical protein